MFGFEMATANVDEGYAEALLRSMRKGFLTDNIYNQLKVTSNISEFKLVLEDTDYGADIFRNQEGGSDFEVTALRTAMKDKLAREWRFIQSQAVYPLSAFMEMLLHGYQIDNVVFVIEGLKSGRNFEQLMRTADPLGVFPQLKNIQPMGDDDYASLYQNVLVDLPVGVYFRKFLNEVTAGAQADDNVEVDTKFIAEAMADYSLQQVQLRVRKIWLTELFEFCQTQLGETSAVVMEDLLKFESDLMTIQIISNSLSFGGMPNSVNREQERKKYMSKIGYLYPDRAEMLNNVTDHASLLRALVATPYEPMMKMVANSEDRNEAESSGATLDEAMLVEASRRYSMGFEGAFHVGCFYAYLKLKEQEIKNVTWLAELVQMQVSRNMPGWNKYVVPFRYHLDEVEQAGRQ